MINCLTCTSPTPNPKFCTRSCAAKYNNANSPKRKLSKQCKTCGSLIRADRSYCSKPCYHLRPKKPKTSKRSYDYVKSSRRKLKIRGIDYLGGKCVTCGYNKCSRALHFHHVDPLEKDFNVASKIRAWDKIKNELDKCILLCSNCHAELHYDLDQ